MTAGIKGVDTVDSREVDSREVSIDPCKLPNTSRTLGSDSTAELSSCTPCETIGVVEVLVELVVVLRVLELLVELVVELLERLAGFSAMIRCFDLLGICLAMDFETKSEELSRLKFKRNSSSRRSCLLTTLKII